MVPFLPASALIPKPAGLFYLVEGPHGCGKTTALQEAVVLSPPGVLYYEVSDGTQVNFAVELASALGIDFACPSAS